MKIRCILAGSMVALLLSALSLGAACELSCTFGAAGSDCHSPQSQSSATAAASMDGMDMAGMAMPGMAGGEQQPEPSEPGLASARAAHPSIGDMGPCERQSCDDASSLNVKSNRAGALQLQSAPIIAQHPSAASVSPPFRDARDDIAPYLARSAGPLSLSLRI